MKFVDNDSRRQYIWDVFNLDLKKVKLYGEKNIIF